ncbi:hypothetical protein KC19_VG093000 [Ceratodon purpureus]|uniref:Uncharacterized protein n=1 Tax=Ceratodon purpureus TaxID=3225 RepID=A0A8T0HP36_CERPU|nr:hypothetical protein KC19_VG093000 [Ceratodon purpureus]
MHFEVATNVWDDGMFSESCLVSPLYVMTRYSVVFLLIQISIADVFDGISSKCCFEHNCSAMNNLESSYNLEKCSCVLFYFLLFFSFLFLNFVEVQSPNSRVLVVYL